MNKEEIINIQKDWASGIIKMGKLSNDRESLESFTSDFLDKIYDFQNQVLFKPTKAANEQFRNTKDSAFSYFIAGDNRICTAIAETLGNKITPKMGAEAVYFCSLNDLGLGLVLKCRDGSRRAVEFALGQILKLLR